MWATGKGQGQRHGAEATSCLQFFSNCMETGDLLADAKLAKIVVSHSHFEMVDGVLFHIGADKIIRVIPPTGE